MGATRECDHVSDSSAFVQERRRHERRAVSVPVSVQGDDWHGAVTCESLDVSVGGMRLRSREALPDGRCVVVIDSSVALVGVVLESVIDIATGEVLSRVRFAETPPAAKRRLIDLTAEAGAATTARRRRPVLVFAAVAGLAGALGVALTVAGDGGSGEAGKEIALARVSTPTTALAAPDVAVAPTVDPAPASVVESDPAPSVAPQVAPPTTVPAPAPAPAPAAAPAMVTRQETSDHDVRVVVAPEGGQSSAASTVGPSDGVDPVRMQLSVVPEPRGTVFDVMVTVENRTDDVLELGDVAVVRASQDGDVVASVALSWGEVRSLAPGERAIVEGAIDLGAPGEYDLDASTEVSAPAEG